MELNRRIQCVLRLLKIRHGAVAHGFDQGPMMVVNQRKQQVVVGLNEFPRQQVPFGATLEDFLPKKEVEA